MLTTSLNIMQEITYETAEMVPRIDDIPSLIDHIKEREQNYFEMLSLILGDDGELAGRQNIYGVSIFTGQGMCHLSSLVIMDALQLLVNPESFEIEWVTHIMEDPNDSEFTEDGERVSRYRHGQVRIYDKLTRKAFLIDATYGQFDPAFIGKIVIINEEDLESLFPRTATQVVETYSFRDCSMEFMRAEQIYPYNITVESYRQLVACFAGISLEGGITDSIIIDTHRLNDLRSIWGLD